MKRDKGFGIGNVSADLADRGDQLGHRVLAGDCVVKDVELVPAAVCPPTPRHGDHVADRVEDPLRGIAGRQSTPPVRQRRGVKLRRVDRISTRRFPPQIERDRLGGLTIG